MVKSACESLGKIGDPKSVPSLIRLMFFERTGVSFYREASYALFQVGAPAVPALIDLYEGKAKNLDELHVDPNLQKTKAVVVMGDLGDPSTFKYVEAAAGNTGEDTASALLRIEGMRAAGRLGLEKVVPSMLKRFDNPDISQSEHDLATLTQLGKKQIAAELATLVGSDGFLKNCKKKFTEDQCKFSEAQIRKPRIIALTRLGAGPELAAVEKMITAEKNEKVKAALEEAKPRLVVGKDCAGKGVACFKSHLKDKEAPARERAAYELVWTNTDEARDALLDALHDDDNEVRYAAIIGVGRRLPQDKKLADVLQKQLDEEKGKTQFIRVNEDLKRLEIRVRRGA
jgi:HEAT repeat protein